MILTHPSSRGLVQQVWPIVHETGIVYATGTGQLRTTGRVRVEICVTGIGQFILRERPSWAVRMVGNDPEAVRGPPQSIAANTQMSFPF